MAKDLEVPMDETTAVQLHLLAILLNLTDLNDENFGLNSRGSLFIVDCSINQTYRVFLLLIYLSNTEVFKIAITSIFEQKTRHSFLHTFLDSNTGLYALTRSLNSFIHDGI